MCVAEFGHHQLQQRSEGWRRWMLSGRSHVASAGICYPPPPCTTPTPQKTCPHPHLNPAYLCQIRLARCQVRPADGSRAAACPEGPFGGLTSGELILLRPPPWELTPPDHSAQCRGSAGRMGHWGGGCSICSLWRESHSHDSWSQLLKPALLSNQSKVGKTAAGKNSFRN